MKKYIFFFAAAAALVACSKNEVTPDFSNENAEISYNVAPKTKATTDFNTGNVFVSYAYYLPLGKTWNVNSADASLYINGSLIEFDTDNLCWKNKDAHYYWPKDKGSLTFFAWSLNKNNVELTEGSHSATNSFQCNKEHGIFGNIDLTPAANKNTDFLVADIMTDQTKNNDTPMYNYTGVPTLFRHKLSMVACAVKTDKAYSNKTFTLNSINFLKIANAGYYAQLPTETFLAETGSAKDDKLVYTATDQVIEATEKYITTTDQVIYVPQTFDENTLIQVNYTVTTKVENSTDVVETCVVEKKVKDIFSEWKIGYKYVFHLNFSLDEILWDPAVEDWTTENSSNIEIK